MRSSIPNAMAPIRLSLAVLLCLGSLCATLAQENFLGGGVAEMEAWDSFVAERYVDPELLANQPLRGLRVDRMLVAINPNVTITASPTTLTVSAERNVS